MLPRSLAARCRGAQHAAQLVPELMRANQKWFVRGLAEGALKF